MAESGQAKKKRRERFEKKYGKAHRCFFCKKAIAGEYDIHHRDGDHSNEDVKNFAAAHPFCHRSHHSKGNKHRVGKTLSAEHKRAISEANRGNKHTLGHKPTKETRQKMSDAAKGKPKSPAHRASMVEAWRRRREREREVS